MIFIASRLVFLAGVVGLLLGCAAGGASSLSASQVEKLSNVDLCYLNRISPMGFVSLEVDRRTRDRQMQFNCENHDRAILEALLKVEADGGSANIPEDMFYRSECKDIALGNIVIPHVTGSGGWRTSDFRHRQYVRNSGGAESYVLFRVGASRRMLAKIPRQSEQLLLFGNYFDLLNRTAISVEIKGCRSF